MAHEDDSWFTPRRARDDAELAAAPQNAGHEDAGPLSQSSDQHGGAHVPQRSDQGVGALVPQRPDQGMGAGVWQRSGLREDAPFRDDHDVGAVIGWPELTDWVRRHRIVLAGVILIVTQLVWKAFFLSHFFFSQDDFHYLDRSLDNGLTWKFLTYEGAGHLIPGPYAVAWVLARVSLYDWGLACTVTLILLAATGLALLRLLRNLFGDRPAILIPLAIYLFTPLTMPDLALWSSAIESLPLQFATFMALDSHVRYVRGGRAARAARAGREWTPHWPGETPYPDGRGSPRGSNDGSHRGSRYGYAVAAAFWMIAGMLFFEKGVVLPLLLFAVTSGFFVEGNWLRAARLALTRYWRAWLLYGAVLVAYVAVFVSALHTSSAQPGSPGSYRNALTFMSELAKNTFVPGALGGPWQWFPQPQQAFAYGAPPTGLTWLTWLAAAVIVVASGWNRHHAWRAWAILAGWLVVTDMFPAILGRIRVYGPILGFETRYVADAAPVLALCLGLAFLPVVGQRDTRRARRERREPAAPGQVAPALTAAILGAFFFGSLWSVQAYETATTSGPARAYIANARAALAAAPTGTVIVDEPVPPALMTAVIFGQYGLTSKLVGAMSRGEPASRLRWASQPQGTIDHLLIFGQDGRLRQAGVVGTVSPPLQAGMACWQAKGTTVTVPLGPVTVKSGSTLRIGYLADAAGTVTVSFGGRSAQVTLQPGLHNAYLATAGSAQEVTVTGLGNRQLCVGNAAVGALLPVNSAPPIPAVAAAG